MEEKVICRLGDQSDGICKWDKWTKGAVRNERCPKHSKWKQMDRGLAGIQSSVLIFTAFLSLG